jgi:protein SCO1
MTHRFRAFGVVMWLGLATVLAACSGRDGAARQTEASTPPTIADNSGGPSIYDLDLALTDHDGRTLALADLRGRVLVAAMVYSSCRSVCPRVTEDMKGIEKQISDQGRKDVGFVLFSLDPGRDTPAALRQFAGEHALDLSRWRLFASSEDGVRDLSAVLGVKYQPEDNGEIAHSAMIFVIDREGVVRHRQVGLSQNPQELVAALAHARR